MAPQHQGSSFAGPPPILYINISYAADGTPSASPAAPEIPPGTKVVWRGPQNDSRPFSIIFPTADPSGPAGIITETEVSGGSTPLTLKSMQTAGMMTKSVPQETTFAYLIEVPDPNTPGAMISADPIIIVRP